MLKTNYLSRNAKHMNTMNTLNGKLVESGTLLESHDHINALIEVLDCDSFKLDQTDRDIINEARDYMKRNGNYQVRIQCSNVSKIAPDCDTFDEFRKAFERHLVKNGHNLLDAKILINELLA
jgi:hypothetical protein